MDLDAFDFDLPEALIALRPAEPRDSARLLVVHGDGRLEDRTVRDLPDYLGAGDIMVFNDTRVLPAALRGVRLARDERGRDVEVDVNLLESVTETRWRALVRPARRLRVGDEVRFAGDFTAAIVSIEGGEAEFDFALGGAALLAALERHGQMPLPPYIARRRAADAADRERYQTIYAGEEARSVAAPTAGLHFTEDLLASLDAAGVERATVRLHVGQGTFAPLSDEALRDSRLHAEWRAVSPETAARLNAVRAGGGRIVPVGTTSLRTLESAVGIDGRFQAVTGPTDIFIKPGDTLRATDALMTNFHLPRSSLFMLVSALMGTDLMQAVYAHAIKARYRFYSYGDACLLLPERS